MPIRDIVLSSVIFALLPVCLVFPWIGVLVWSWLGYMNPHRLTWGFAYSMPFAMMVVIPTLIGLLFTRDKKPLPKSIEVYLLLALWGLMVLSTLGAYYPERAWLRLEEVSKILLVTLVTMLLFQDTKKLRWLLVVIALSIGFFGLKGGIWALSTGGMNQVLGPSPSFIAGNTEIGLALNMVIPLLLLLSRTEERRWLRLLMRAVLIFSIPAVVFTYSRGAMVGLMVILPLMFLKKRMKFAVLPLAIGVLFLVFAFAPDRWSSRMETIQEYEQDMSANMRLNSWYVAYRLGLEHPLLGAGFKPFSPAVYGLYTPESRLNKDQDAHSIYLQVLAEHGVTGLGLYLALIACTLVSLRQVRRRARGNPELAFHHDAAQMVEVSLAAFLVSGAFLSLSYFDLFFHLVAITVMLKVLVFRPQPAPAPARAVPARVRTLPQPARARL